MHHCTLYRNLIYCLQQKLVIGDDSGQVFCYEFKRGEPQVVFQSKVFEGPITSVALAGPPTKKDNVRLQQYKESQCSIIA